MGARRTYGAEVEEEVEEIAARETSRERSNVPTHAVAPRRRFRAKIDVALDRSIPSPPLPPPTNWLRSEERYTSVWRAVLDLIGRSNGYNRSQATITN